MSPFIEVLEDRSLMSATLQPAVSATIIAAENAVIAARQQLRTDTVMTSGTIRDAQVHVRLVRAQDNAQIRSDRLQFRLDRGNPNARSAELGVIEVDQAKLRTDIVTANQAVRMDQGDRRITLADDRIAINQANITLRRDRLLHL
jgi:hypothetical protein